ncbi:CapA family protein [Candidatus Kuenenbacteria bacterium]|nr:CapA family protein [Candidatus Kuenenbacteria bacterium]
MKNRNLIIIVFGTALALTLGLFFLSLWLLADSKFVPAEKTIINTRPPAIINKLEPEGEQVKIIVVGDIMLSRTVEQKMIGYKDFNYPFLKTANYLERADLAFGNLETAITPGRIIQAGEMAFRADPKVAGVLANNNFGIVSLANNHSPNFAQTGLEDTFKYLDEEGIKYIGAGKNKEMALAPQYTEIKGIKIAWLARTEQLMVPDNYEAGASRAGTAFWDKEEIKKAIKDAKKQADLVFVSIHAGQEYTNKPTEKQKQFARAAIEAGAEIIIGHHPHVVQSAEKYQNKYIFYSLGNFIFDQMWSRETREGLMLGLMVEKDGIKKIEALPILIEDYSQPRVLAGEQGERIIKRLELEYTKNQDDYKIK